MNKKTGGRHLTGRRMPVAGKLFGGNETQLAEKTSSEKRTGLIARLSEQMKRTDSGQRRAGRNLAVFLILMLAMTLIARGTAAATLPRVTAEAPFNAEVTETVRGTATIKTGEKTEIRLPEGLTVLEVMQSSGAKVNAGDALLKLDPEALAALLAQERVTLENLKLKKDQLGQSNAQDNSGLISAQRTVERAISDYNTTQQQENASVAKAQNAYDRAKKELADAKEVLNGLMDGRSRGTYQGALSEEDALDSPDLNGPSDPLTESGGAEESSQPVATAPPVSDPAEDALGVAQQEVAEKTAALTQAEEQLDSAKIQRDNSMKSAQRAIDDARLSLESAQKSEANAQQEQRNREDQNAVDAKSTQLEIDTQQKKVTTLEALVDKGGVISAENGGTVLEIAVAGTKTSEGTAAVSLSNAEGAYEAEMVVTRQEASKVDVGAKAELMTESGGMGANSFAEGVVAAVFEEDATGMVTLKIRLPNQKWKQGTSMQVRVVQKSAVYDECLPLSALRADGNDYYVLTMQEKNTILGSEQVLTKVPVTVLSRGDGLAAVSGSFMPGEKIITGSDKPISEGDRVRLQE